MKAKVDAHRARTSGDTGEKESSDSSRPDDRKSYSRETFADALIEWITVNDQVRSIVVPRTCFSLTHQFYSPSM